MKKRVWFHRPSILLAIACILLLLAGTTASASPLNNFRYVGEYGAVGSTLVPRTSATLEGCASACLAQSQCQYFVHEASVNACVLYASNFGTRAPYTGSRFYERTPSPQPPPVQPPSASVPNNFRYVGEYGAVGSPLFPRSTASLESCANTCLAQSQCQFFVHEPSANACVLYAANFGTLTPYTGSRFYERTTLPPTPPVSSPAIKVSVAGIEVTQSIQNMAHNVTLVANRKTYVRVYLDLAEGREVILSGKISITPTRGAPIVLDPIRPVFVQPSYNGKLDQMRDQFERSLNFEIPQQRLAAGTYSVALTQVMDSAGIDAQIGCTNCTTTRRDIVVSPDAPLRLVVIGIGYQSRGVMHWPTTADFANIESWLKRAYPIANLIYEARIVPAVNPSGLLTCGEVNAQLAQIRALDIHGGVDARTHYYGLVADGGYFMRGCAVDIPGAANPGAVASGPTGRPGNNFSWDRDDSYGDWYTAHELGHTLGRMHVGGICGEAGTDFSYPFRGGSLSVPASEYKGLDPNGLQVLSGNSWNDVMSYCNNQWVSSYTYNAIYSRLAQENALPAHGVQGAQAYGGAQRPSASSAGNDLISIIALVNLTKTSGKITSMSVVSTVAQQSLSTPAGPGSQAMPTGIRLIASNGSIIGEYPVVVQKFSDIPANEDQTGLINAVVPFMANVSRIDLVLAGKVIDSKQVSTRAPQFKNLNMPTRGQLGMAQTNSQPLSFQWQAADPDGDSLTYSVQISGDNGATWKTLAVGLTQTRFDVLPEQIQGMQTVKIRVIASDGLNSAVIAGESL